METQYGKKLAVVTDQFTCILPDRFAHIVVTEGAIEELNQTPCVMKYSGKDAKRQNRIMVDFEKQPERMRELTWEDLLVLPPNGELMSSEN